MKDTADKLNDILGLLNDSYSCLKDHANDLKDERLKNLFLIICQHRKKAIEELSQVIADMGEEPTHSRTVLGTAHQFYENLKKLFTNNDPLVITKELKRGENILIENYKEAINSPMPDEIKSLLIKQMNEVEEDIKNADMATVTS